MRLLLLLVFSTMLLHVVRNCTAWMMTTRSNHTPRRRSRSIPPLLCAAHQQLPSSHHFLPDPSCEPSQMSGTELAYIGDCVYELFVRSRVVWPSMRTTDLHQRVVKLVNADHQSKLLRKMMADDNFEFQPQELQVLRRGRNSCRKTRRNPADKDATALEALVGYLFVQQQDDTTRLNVVLDWLAENLEAV